ncbi:MAG TPA: endonuclease/exonuclease/phosphatase family protein [Aliiroseovarius sp.]|nr:endonuclease/exonuclease/phosphatase family protein [Aliiroseovarius sp.]
MRRLCAAVLLLAWLALPAAAGVLRIATFNTELARKGPGLLLRGILRGEDAQIAAVVAVIRAVRPDILLLQGFDWDLDQVALTAFRDRLAADGGPLFPYLYAPRPNSGVATGLDMDGNGRLNEPRDAQGYGRFTGQGGMALLSSLPIDLAAARDFSAFPWRDLPGALLPQKGGVPFPSAEAQAAQRLSSAGHWDVPVILPDGSRLHLLAFHATPPVFDGPEDLNGRRNHDEIMFWPLLLDGTLPFAPPGGPLVLLGDANQDPVDGEGLKDAIRALLTDSRLSDPAPTSPGAAALGDATDTVDWDDPTPGNLRVDYVLPGHGLRVVGSGVWWPAPGTPEADTAAAASRHRLVWADIQF